MQRADTSGAGTFGLTGHPGGDGSIIEGLHLHGGYAGVESEAHGIHIKAACTVRNCAIYHFPGDGIHIHANAGAAGAAEGNANAFEIDKVFIESCRNGIFANGADANAGTINAPSVIACRRWGIWDSSFLGNNYTGGRIEACGTAGADGTAAHPASTVSHNGNWYYAVPGQEAGASTNAPSGTSADNGWWKYWQSGAPGTGVPAWASGIAVRAAGAIRTDEVTSPITITGMYTESGQPPSQLENPTLVIGGFHGAGIVGMYGYLAVSNGKLFSYGDLLAGRDVSVTRNLNVAGGLTAAGVTDSVGITTTGPLSALGSAVGLGPVTGTNELIVSLRNTSTYSKLDFLTSGVSQGEITGSASALYLFGTTTLNLGCAGAYRATLSATGLNLSNGGDLMFNGAVVPLRNVAASRLIGRGSAGAGIAQEITPGANLGLNGTSLQVQFAASGKLLARLTAGAGAAEEAGLANGLVLSGGNLGLGAITPTGVASSGDITSSGGKIGYAAGAGGTIVQATNKSTGVTLNKVCGEITLNAAALAANTAVTFTLTNSQIAAGDRIVLNHSSAGTFGAYLIDGRAAAGSATIMVRNVTAGALSEAIGIGFAVVRAVTA